MEAIFFAVDIIGMVWLLYWAIINDDREQGSPTTGLFAYRETIRTPPRPGFRPPPGGPHRYSGASTTSFVGGQRRPPAPPSQRIR